MKILHTLLYLFLCLNLNAANIASQSPVSMEQLMRELHIRGGNWSFKFDRPVLAYAVFKISSFPDGDETEITSFLSDEASDEIDLFFMNAPLRIQGSPYRGELKRKKFSIRISTCSETKGTRILHYVDKFSTPPWSGEPGQLGDFRPSIALHPELNKEYILAYIFREGDPFEVKATISFIEAEEDIDEIEKFDLDGVRDWKEAGGN